MLVLAVVAGQNGDLHHHRQGCRNDQDLNEEPGKPEQGEDAPSQHGGDEEPAQQDEDRGLQAGELFKGQIGNDGSHVEAGQRRYQDAEIAQAPGDRVRQLDAVEHEDDAQNERDHGQVEDLAQRIPGEQPDALIAAHQVDADGPEQQGIHEIIEHEVRDGMIAEDAGDHRYTDEDGVGEGEHGGEDALTGFFDAGDPADDLGNDQGTHDGQKRRQDGRIIGHEEFLGELGIAVKQHETGNGGPGQKLYDEIFG